MNYQYMIQIRLENNESHELWFERQDFEFFTRLFSILDTTSCGSVERHALREFVTLRCPVFWRRDDDLRKLETQHTTESPTFDEVWEAVIQCSHRPTGPSNYLGVEGWMVFCRFIALAQYLEAKRRFSARHLQQTMRHRNSPRGSEMVVVDVPPLAAPLPLTQTRLAEHERISKTPLPLPELDLDHSMVAAHDAIRRRSSISTKQGEVKVSLFGSKPKAGNILTSATDVEFALAFTSHEMMGDEIVVRRSFSDMKWLHRTFKSHQGLGGTLCGRILPPFPANQHSKLATLQPDEKTIQNAIDGTGAAVKAAAAGVGMITNFANSFWGNYGPSFNGKKTESKPKPVVVSQKKKKKKQSKSALHSIISEKYYNPYTPEGKARQLERCLNFLLEHPALSASFSLNTILKSSQSGLAAAKTFLDDHSTAKKELLALQLDDSWRTSPTPPNLGWVRTAAQAAMALKVHGLLETTGLPSASARLQHASLPYFSNHVARNNDWADDDVVLDESPSLAGDVGGAEGFEEGVIHVDNVGDHSGGDKEEGYDLLPLPIPAPERRILCAGSTPDPELLIVPGEEGHREERFHYGSGEGTKDNIGDQCEVESAFLGDFPVDENIDKLREVIGSVDNTLSRCLSACASIGEARRERLAYHRQLVHGLDSWEGLRGRFISQQALLKGASGLCQSREIAEESDLELIDDVSWQSALASSAVSAAEDVRSTVRAARTAANAKAAADAAAFTAHSACDGNFASIDEARAAQTRASIARSHAIHAAVVEHEANTAKRRAALALAHDVKCWNVHRKRELLKSCLAYAKSQHVATRRAVDSWSCLRDGYLGSTLILEGRIQSGTSNKKEPERRRPPLSASIEEEEPHAQIYSEIDPGMESAMGAPTIEAVDHYILSAPLVEEAKLLEEKNKPLTAIEEEESSSPPIVDAAPVEEAAPLAKSTILADTEAVEPISTVTTTTAPITDEFFSSSSLSTTKDASEKNGLSNSMQSLVDGLMSWGGQYDSEDDLNLPVGMAASIVLEGSGAS